MFSGSTKLGADSYPVNSSASGDIRTLNLRSMSEFSPLGRSAVRKRYDVSPDPVRTPMMRSKKMRAASCNAQRALRRPWACQVLLKSS